MGTDGVDVAQDFARDVAQDFARDVAQHEMTVFMQAGVYRHLRFRRPSGNTCWFDLVTWPGNLAFNGDMGTYVFARIDDMFAFFRGDHINPGYWAQKLRGANSVFTYSYSLLREQVAEAISGYVDDLPGLRTAVDECLDCYCVETERETRDFLRDFLYEESGRTFRFRDTWEWDLRDWSYRYLWACHAIQWGVSQCDAVRPPESGVSADAR